MLYRTSESDRNAARLDWYDDEKSFQTNPSIRKTLFIEEIMLVERLANDAETQLKYGDVGRSAVHFVLFCTCTQVVLIYHV